VRDNTAPEHCAICSGLLAPQHDPFMDFHRREVFGKRNKDKTLARSAKTR